MVSPTKRSRGAQSGPLSLEVLQHLLAAAAEEMGACLQRSAFSTNIKERRDFSCAVFDSAGRMLAQAAHIPVHLGSMPMCTKAVLAQLELGRGDCAILNDPFQGGTHLPDITLVAPVCVGKSRRPSFYVANRAHHADVGGPVPGSMAPAADVHGEGLRIPPMLLVQQGRIRQDVLSLLEANMRVPAERRGDLMAQIAACHHGQARMSALALELGAVRLESRASDLLDWTASLVEQFVRRLPARRFEFEDTLESPAREGTARQGTKPGTIRLHCSLRASGGRLLVDWSKSDDQVGGGIATVRAVTQAAVFYVARLFLETSVPTNDGLWQAIEVRTRPGSLVDARYPAAVAGGNVETSQRLVDCLLGALAKALPGQVPAASSGTMCNLSFGGTRMDGRPFAYYETIAGGAGASRRADGASALQTHMTNTRNTPIEALETNYPVRVLRYSIRRHSGGAGQRRGGDGIEKALLFLEPARVTWIADRCRAGPWGLAGGSSGAPSRARRRSGVAAHGPALDLGSAASLQVEPGSVIEVLTPGGGGYGIPRSRRSRR